MARISQQVDQPKTMAASEKANLEYWLTDEGLTSELRFHDRVYYLVRSIAGHYRVNHLQGICTDLARLMWVENWIEDEVFIATYESGLVAAQLSLAHACSDRYMLDEAYDLIECCRDVLLGKRGRRMAMKLAFRPDSECWYRLFEALAELKWKGPGPMKNRIMSPEAIIDQYFEVENRCLEYIQRNPCKNEERDKRIKLDLGYSLIQIIKMSIRWCPSNQEVLVQRFNNLQGPVLSAKTGHFLSGKPVNAENPWYWDHELFKWCVLGPATEDEAILCHQWRLDSMRQSGSPDRNLESYKLGSGIELDQLLRLNTTREQPHVC